MEKRKFAIVPTEDEIMFLSGKKKRTIACSACGVAYDGGGTVICNAAGTRSRFCYNCLEKMQTVLYEGKISDCEMQDFSVSRYDGNKPSSFFNKNKAEFLFCFANSKLYLTADELTMVFLEVRNFNRTHNIITINRYKRKQQLKYETKLKELKNQYYGEAIQAIEATSDPETAKKYFLTAVCNRESFLKNASKKRRAPKKSIKITSRMFDDNNKESTHNIGTKINQVTTETKFITKEDFEPCECDCINHISISPAKYWISTNNKKIPFGLVACPTCLLSLKKAIEQSCNYAYYEDGEVHITKTVFQDNNHCLFCTQNSGTNNRIHIRNIEFNCCDEHKEQLLNTINAALK